MAKSKKKALNLDSPEYRIAVMQLLQLEKLASERFLSVDEAKLYDIYTKNIVLLKQNAVDPNEVTIQENEPKKIEHKKETLIEVARSEPDKPQIMNISDVLNSDKNNE